MTYPLYDILGLYLKNPAAAIRVQNDLRSQGLQSHGCNLWCEHYQRGGGYSGAYRFVSEPLLKDRAYSLFIADDRVAIRFHDRIYVGHDLWTHIPEKMAW